MADFVDIHSHTLPGVDDGAPSFEVVLAMLEVAWDQGVGTMVLTPHLRPIDGPDKEGEHRERFNELKEAARTAGLEIDLHSLQYVRSCRLAFGASGRGMLRFDRFATGAISPGLEQAYFELRSDGFKPILAHPERHRELSSHPEQIDRLRQQDLRLQINAGSLLGRFGRRVQSTAEMMLERGWSDFIGSDAHDLEKRPLSLLSEARERVLHLCGKMEVERLFCRNPSCVFSGEAVLRGEDSHRSEPPRSKSLRSKPLRSKRGKAGFFERLLGRGTNR